MSKPTPQSSSQPPSARLEELLTPSSDRIEELSDSETFEDIVEAEPTQITQEFPEFEMFLSPLRDELVTESSEVEKETLVDVLPFLEGNPYDFDLNSFGLPKLQRAKHAIFLRNALGAYPPQFAAMDAARPWLLYWSLQGLTCLGEDVSEYRERVTYTFSSAQHPTGGFGGGHGQLPHLAASYAAVLSLIIVGGTDAYDSIDRKAMWHYLGAMKQRDGGFTMAPGGEQDIRGAFCAMVIVTLLALPLALPPNSPAYVKGEETFLTNLPEWVARCQAFDGGMAAAPGNEAHGAYAFCALGCLVLLGDPRTVLQKYLDLPALLGWLASRQTQPEGGFQGRTNKLVDGCYSHWVGGCWAIVEAAVVGGDGKGGGVGQRLWRREALARYILACCQAKKGGLRDKPGKYPDAYHTCYNLAGLSATQHRYVYDYSKSSGPEAAPLSAAFNWTVADVVGEEGKVWDDGDEVKTIHPVFAVPWGQAEAARKHFEGKDGF